MGNQSLSLRSIVDRIRPSVVGPLEADVEIDRATLLAHAIRSNVRVSADNLSYGSPIIEQLVQGKNSLLSARNTLETAIVEFFYNAPLPD